MDASTVTRAHTQRLRGLYAVTTLIANNSTLQPLLHPPLDPDLPSTTPPDSAEAAWLQLNDLTFGHTFDSDSLPHPLLLPQDDTPSARHSTTTTGESSRPADAAPELDALANEASLIPTPDTPAPLNFKIDGDAAMARTRLQKALASDGPTAPPEKLVTPAVEEEAQDSAASKAPLNLDAPHTPAKTVQLPQEDVQEERVRDRCQAIEDERPKAEPHKPSQPSLATAQDLASSPSSTLDAHSTATPMPPQDSPDTSPDSESPDLEILPPKDMRPKPEEGQTQEQRDRLSEAQAEGVGQEALGSEETTADDQLRWEAREAREAAARDAEERVPREDADGPEASAQDATSKTAAQEVTEDVDAPNQLAAPDASDSQAAINQPTLPTRGEDDGDNIVVTPRVRPPPIDTSGQQHVVAPPCQTAEAAPAPPRMTTRVSSGAMARRSVSDILGETPTAPPESSVVRKGFHSPEMMSPTVARQPRGSHHLASAESIPTPRHLAPPSRQTPSTQLASIEHLSALRGAASESGRDYLEPLFRIQAHDSPNSKSKPLPNLVKDAAKAVSTGDQFTNIHERMDHRILRRIYQLQNANKWSLRQMERSKEPVPVFTHHDHMMTEMKWMRKDFKAERQMKKSVCAWLARRCADWISAGIDERRMMQVRIKASSPDDTACAHEDLPELDTSLDSAPEDAGAPATPADGEEFPGNLIVPHQLSDVVTRLRKSGHLKRALEILPTRGLPQHAIRPRDASLIPVSKFAENKVLPVLSGSKRKRGRFDYNEDGPDMLSAEHESKRRCDNKGTPPEEQEVALFHPDNKHIRDRLHANTAFRPPSEFAMPTVAFYEWRNGSQWIWEDDQKLRKLAKEYTFNWSLIADELSLPSRYKSSADRRSPWECFERWVELETLPAEMRKTVYFKTWFSRLETSNQAAERRYQAQVAAIQQQQAQNGQQISVPMRRRSTPSRVEKRKNTRYLWAVDAMRKLAKKRENNAYKQAEAQRAAAQRKSQSDSNAPQRGPMLTPQEWSKRRYERDLQVQELQRQHRAKMMEAQQRQLQMARQAQQQGAPGGVPPQSRPGNLSVPAQQAQTQASAQAAAAVNGQLPQQGRPPVATAPRNGNSAVPHINVQGIPQAQMRAGGIGVQYSDVQRLAQANAQRAVPYSNHQYAASNGSMQSPGSGGMTTQQQLQSNQALIAQMHANANSHAQHMAASSGAHQMSASPSMPPPPAPHAQPQQLSSGHVPALLAIKNDLRAKYTHFTEDQLNSAATGILTKQSQTQSSNQARQNAMNAAAGISSQAMGANLQAYAQNQATYQANGQMANGALTYMNGDGSLANQNSLSFAGQSAPNPAQYQALLRQRTMQQMQQQMRQSPVASHATLNGSPAMAHASPSVAMPVSPTMQFSSMASQVPGMAAGLNQRPPSHGATSQMQRLGSSNGLPGVGMASGMQSPGGTVTQGSPRGMQASMAR